MSQLLKILLGSAAAIAIAFWSVNTYNDTKESYEYRLAKEQLRSEYLERAAPVRTMADPDAYDTESRALFKWYFGELTKLYNRFPTYRVSEEQYLEELEAKKDSMKGEVYAASKASYEQIREIWDLLRSGKYSPELTATDASMRIDFLEFEPTTLDGQKGIKGRFVLWGAQRRRLEERVGGATQTRVEVQASFSDMHVTLTDEKNLLVAEMTFGLPHGPFVPYPEVRMEDFPPMAYIGSFFFPAIPHEAVNAEISGGVRSRSSSGELSANFNWKMPVPTAWKLGEGQVWEGATREEREGAAPARAVR